LIYQYTQLSYLGKNSALGTQQQYEVV